jgi:hypothetical protein
VPRRARLTSTTPLHKTIITHLPLILIIKYKGKNIMHIIINRTYSDNSIIQDLPLYTSPPSTYLNSHPPPQQLNIILLRTLRRVTPTNHKSKTISSKTNKRTRNTLTRKISETKRAIPLILPSNLHKRIHINPTRIKNHFLKPTPKH